MLHNHFPRRGIEMGAEHYIRKSVVTKSTVNTRGTPMMR